MAFEVGAVRYTQDRHGTWHRVVITYIDDAPWSDLVVVRWPDGEESKTDANLLEFEPPAG